MTFSQFITHFHYLLPAIVLALHLSGYMVENYFYHQGTFVIWLIVASANTAIAFITSRLIQALYHGIYLDSLTGLNNRGFFAAIAKELERIKTAKMPLSVLMVDIDNFKDINDTYGHLAGDNVLKDVATIFKQCIRDEDVIIRWGGEEFLVILRETNPLDALVIAERVRSTVENHDFPFKPEAGRITISLGIASMQEPSSLDQVIPRADKALYKAKQQGRNRIAMDKEPL